MRLEAHGVDVEEGPVLCWGAHAAGTSIYFRDPEGNIIAVSQRVSVKKEMLNKDKKLEKIS